MTNSGGVRRSNEPSGLTSSHFLHQKSLFMTRERDELCLTTATAAATRVSWEKINREDAPNDSGLLFCAWELAKGQKNLLILLTKRYEANRHESTLISLRSKLRFDKCRVQRWMTRSFVLRRDQRHRRQAINIMWPDRPHGPPEKPPDSHLWKLWEGTVSLQQMSGRWRTHWRSLEAISVEGGWAASAFVNEGRLWGQRSAARDRHGVDSCVCGSAAFVFFTLSAREWAVKHVAVSAETLFLKVMMKETDDKESLK